MVSPDGKQMTGAEKLPDQLPDKLRIVDVENNVRRDMRRDPRYAPRCAPRCQGRRWESRMICPHAVDDRAAERYFGGRHLRVAEGGRRPPPPGLPASRDAAAALREPAPDEERAATRGWVAADHHRRADRRSAVYRADLLQVQYGAARRRIRRQVRVRGRSVQEDVPRQQVREIYAETAR